jgi:hypothetical protein
MQWLKINKIEFIGQYATALAYASNTATQSDTPSYLAQCDATDCGVAGAGRSANGTSARIDDVVPASLVSG